ncbi:MAG TPA: sulfurtransferase TusA family protein [Ruminiclostridium sp.]|jgi:TusA-related sulfurtransferase|nr:sulfurtransferase TusA family protein [Ruminiclostridium sp.]
MITIDCLGEMCPIPVLKTKKALKSLSKHDSVKVITDHNCVAQSIISHFDKRGFSVQPEEVMNGVWEIIITVV